MGSSGREFGGADTRIVNEVSGAEPLVPETESGPNAPLVKDGGDAVEGDGVGGLST